MTPPPFATRVLLLGASNVTMGLRHVLGTTRRRLGPGPLAIFVAAGHGRSYGRWSRVGVRGLPGILECGVWAEAGALDGARTYALVTDVGNDLAYNESPSTVAGWVTSCLDRLADFGAETVLTLLPAPSLERLSAWQYQVVRTVFYPRCRIPFAALPELVEEVNAQLAGAAAQRSVTVVTPKAEWYRADAIHFQRSQRRTVWSEILSRWAVGPGTSAPHADRIPARRWWGMAPERRSVLGIPLRRRQPSVRLPGGTAVSLF